MIAKQDGMPIGAVSRMTGLTGHTLRKWESRYGVVVPERTETGRRVYTREQIDKLMIVRELVERGHQIGGLAGKSAEELRQLLDESRARRAESTRRHAPSSVVVVGHVLGADVRLNAAEFAPVTSLRIVASSATDFLDSAFDLAGVEVVVLECPTLPRALAEKIADAAGDSAVTVVYGFTSDAALKLLQNAGVSCRRAPVTARELAATLSAEPAVGRSPTAEIAPPRFSQDAIAKVLSHAPTIHCECPRHIAQLLFDLGAFETYSRECETVEIADAALHRYFGDIAGAARAAFEDALERVAVIEGIALPAPRAHDERGSA